MRYVIFFFIIQLVALSTNAQDLNLGEVRYDSAFNCSNSRLMGFDKNFNAPDICDSKNDLEIRLKMFVFPHGKSELVILSYKDGAWDAKKYILDRGRLGRKLTTISFIPPDWDTTTVKRTCIDILNCLIEDRIFLLPDQSELKHDMNVMDGIQFVISYKTDKLFRAYSYSNPDNYHEQHPDSREYAHIMEIVKILRGLF